MVATLGTLADRVREEGLGSPAVVVVGPVAALAPEIGWREGPLLGRTVVVTRARAQASGLTERLRALGAAVVELPAIRIHPLDETPEDAAMVANIGSYGLVVLTSVNGVDALFERLDRLGRDARAIPEEATVVAIGPATAERLPRTASAPTSCRSASWPRASWRRWPTGRWRASARWWPGRAARGRSWWTACASWGRWSTSWSSTRRSPRRRPTPRATPPSAPTT